MGTALTKEQARLVKRYSDTALISYDGDFAGQKNNLRGLEILASEGLNVRVVPMPEGLDPDDVVKQGAKAYQKCLDEAMPLVDYKLFSVERKYDLKKTEDKRNFLSEALQIVAEAESESVKEELLKRLRDKTGITYHSLERDLHAKQKEKPREEKAEGLEKMRISETASSADQTVKAIRFILAAKLFSAPYAKTFDLQEVSFSDEAHKIIATYISGCEKADEKIRPSALFELLEENCEELNAILNLNYEDKLSGEIASRFFSDSVRSLQRVAIEKEIARYNELYGVETDEEKKKEMAREIARCVKKRNQLRK
jgi:DNA primase